MAAGHPAAQSPRLQLSQPPSLDPSLKGFRKWTETEVEKLRELSTDYPPDLCHRYYNAWAKKNNYRTRPLDGLRWQRIRHNIPNRPWGIYITSVAFCELYAGTRIVGDTPFAGWHHRGILDVHVFRNRCYIRRQSIIDLALREPHRFINVPRRALVAILDSPKAADMVIQAMPRKRIGIQCTRTGFTWPSIRAAAKARHMSPCTISQAIKAGRPCPDGVTYRYLYRSHPGAA